MPDSYGFCSSTYIDAVSDNVSHKGTEREAYSNEPQDDVDDPTMKKKEPLRKGKWTIEEERYTNKVIEAFNSGSLKLTESDRGITLRAYLADKLGCDPMRITKKYTGASCLGKRVYHALKVQHAAKIEEVERTSAELTLLEEEFRQKLLQMSRRRSNSGSYGGDSTSSTISTPAIDALMKQTSYPSAWANFNMPTASNSPPFQSCYHAIPANTDQAPSNTEYHRETFQPYGGFRESNADKLSNAQPQFHDLRWGHELPQNTISSGQQLYYHHDNIEASSDSDRQHALLPAARSTSPDQLTEDDSTDETSYPDRHPEEPVLGQRASSSVVDSRKVVVTEKDSEAAHSLLGFFTHLERNNSQEDLVEFMEDVQKTAAVASSIPRMGSHRSLVDEYMV